MRLLQPLNTRLEGSWPRASLRTYLLAIILLATLPIGVLMSWQILVDVRSEQSQLEDELRLLCSRAVPGGRA